MHRPRGRRHARERLYRLGSLQPPAGVAGSPRTAHDSDRAVLADWLELFSGEAFGHPYTAGGVFVDAATGRGDRFVLWDVDGTPVSMALLRAPAAGVSRIGPVFTPETHRANGYGSAVTAAAARAALERGDAGVVLFTDLANPTSRTSISGDRVRGGVRRRAHGLPHRGLSVRVRKLLSISGVSRSRHARSRTTG